jgi:ATP-binding cassette subfamily B protein
MAVSVATRVYLVGWLGERVVTDIRSAVFQHVLRMGPTFFEVTRTGCLGKIRVITSHVKNAV